MGVQEIIVGFFFLFFFLKGDEQKTGIDQRKQKNEPLSDQHRCIIQHQRQQRVRICWRRYR
jgi:hypothetical protein